MMKLLLLTIAAAALLAACNKEEPEPNAGGVEIVVDYEWADTIRIK